MLRLIRLPFAALVLGLAFTAAIAACTDDSSVTDTTGTPATGIVIRSESLVGERQCGTGPSQVYKYAAVVGYPASDGNGLNRDSKLFSGVFDCFADGVFVNLPASPTGTQLLRVEVRAYSKATYEANQAALDLLLAAKDDDKGRGTGILALGSTFSTTCTATQQEDLIVLAVCSPLVNGSGDGGAPPVDGGNDAADSSSDASDDGDGGPG